MDLYDYIGLDINKATELFKTIGEDYKVKEFKNHIYISFYKEGISFCFNNKILECIYLYNQGIQGYSMYKSKLPYNLDFKMVSKEIIYKFGDTKLKGKASEIWLSYPHLGIEFTFLNKIWEDSDNPIIFICLFRKVEDSISSCSVCLKDVEKGFSCECGYLRYCSTQCQDVHLPFHKKVCKDR
jgi:hypothetical protein